MKADESLKCSRIKRLPDRSTVGHTDIHDTSQSLPSLSNIQIICFATFDSLFFPFQVSCSSVPSYQVFIPFPRFRFFQTVHVISACLRPSPRMKMDCWEIALSRRAFCRCLRGGAAFPDHAWKTLARLENLGKNVRRLVMSFPWTCHLAASILCAEITGGSEKLWEIDQLICWKFERTVMMAHYHT